MSEFKFKSSYEDSKIDRILIFQDVNTNTFYVESTKFDGLQEMRATLEHCVGCKLVFGSDSLIRREFSDSAQEVIHVEDCGFDIVVCRNQVYRLDENDFLCAERAEYTITFDYDYSFVRRTSNTKSIPRKTEAIARLYEVLNKNQFKDRIKPVLYVTDGKSKSVIRFSVEQLDYKELADVIYMFKCRYINDHNTYAYMCDLKSGARFKTRKIGHKQLEEYEVLVKGNPLVMNVSSGKFCELDRLSSVIVTKEGEENNV